MDCSVCLRHVSSESGLHCPACARSALYSPRIDYATRLLEKSKLGRQVDAIIKTTKEKQNKTTFAKTNSLDIHEGSRGCQHEQTLAETAESRERIEGIVREIELLQQRIDAYKKEIMDRKTAIVARRTNLDSAKATFSSFRSNSVKVVKKVTKKTLQRHVSIHEELISDRAWLCREAALLAGLRQSSPGDSSRVHSYVLGGVTLMDLRRLNDYKPGEVSAALANIANLLFLASYYLGVRLPAEVLIPGEHRPLPLIHSLSSSYKDQDSLDSSSFATTDGGLFGLAHIPHPDKTASRARPLWLDQKLPLLARDDPSQYLKFVQGIALLAWDIAWLCRSQGVMVANEDWEEVCAIGRNLWLLLGQKPAKSPDVPNPTSANHTSGLGSLSHTSTPTFSASTSTRSWKFESPVTIMDKLKSFLLAEMSGLEWEVLDENEFDGVDDQPSGNPGILGHRASPDATELVGGVDGTAETRLKGTSGWTKLKSRPNT